MGARIGRKALQTDEFGLNERDRIFIAAYTRHFDGPKALEEAFPGASENKQSSMASLMKRPEIQAAIERVGAERRKKYAIDADRVLREFAAIAFTELREVVQWSDDGLTLTDSDELTPEQAAAVQEITETVDASGKKTRKIRMNSKVAALESLGKHLRLWDTGNNVNLLSVNLNALPDDALERRVHELMAKAGQALEAGSGPLLIEAEVVPEPKPVRDIFR